jgi:hypothetical protein
VRGALSARYVTLHRCYKDHTLDDIHATDAKDGMAQHDKTNEGRIAGAGGCASAPSGGFRSSNSRPRK